MKNLENSCGYYQRFYQRPHEDNDAKKPQLYWDGYQWVIRPNSIFDHNFDVIKPGRKVQIANVPLHLNIQVNDFKEYLIKYTLEKNVVSKRDVKDVNNIIKGIELDYDNNTSILAMESTDIAKRMILLDGIILLGYTLRFSPYHDINEDENSTSNISKAMALANSAHISAKSHAIAYAALQSFGNKTEGVQINLQTAENKNAIVMIPSKIVKVMNITEPKEAIKFKSEKFEEILEDIKDEFSNYGNIVSSTIITPKKAKIGAECGAIFIEFQDARVAEKCVKGMKGRRYLEKEINVAYIDEIVYKQQII